MKEEILDLNLNPLAEEWFVNQFDGFINGDEKRIKHITFDVKEFTAFVINHVPVSV